MSSIDAVETKRLTVTGIMYCVGLHRDGRRIIGREYRRVAHAWSSARGCPAV